VVSSRNRRSRGAWITAAVVAGGALLAIYVAEAAGAVPGAMGTNPGAVMLNPASGSTGTTPTWSTTVGCPSGFQGSATFKEVHSDGTSTNLIAPIVNGTASAFHGTLQASIALIKTAGNIPNGGSQELFVTCYSMQSGTGNTQNDMDIYLNYSADGSTYTTSTSPTPNGGAASPTPSSSSTPGSSSTPSPSATSSSSSSSGATGSPSVSPSPASSSPAPSPSALNSSFAVTG
jgi:hypothetical protein